MHKTIHLFIHSVIRSLFFLLFSLSRRKEKKGKEGTRKNKRRDSVFFFFFSFLLLILILFSFFIFHFSFFPLVSRAERSGISRASSLAISQTKKRKKKEKFYRRRKGSVQCIYTWVHIIRYIPTSIKEGPSTTRLTYAP